MSELKDTIQSCINNIADNVEPESNLLNLKLTLRGLNSDKFSELATRTPLDRLFDCLNSSNPKQIVAACDALKIFLNALPVSQLLRSDYRPLLLRALSHPATEPKQTVLKELLRCVRSDALMSFIHQEPQFLSSVIECISDSETNVAFAACEFFIKLGKTSHGLQAICQPPVIKEFIEKVERNSVCAVRIFEIAVKISVTSAEALKSLENAGLLDRVAEITKSYDTLEVLSFLQVLTELAITDFGYDALVRHGIMKNLVGQLSMYGDNEFQFGLFSGLTKFFGVVGQVFPEKLIKDFPEVLRCAFSAADDDDVYIRMAALELIGLIAYTPAGKQVLQKEDEMYMRQVMGVLYEAMTKQPSEWRVTALHILADIINNEKLTEDGMKIAENWFDHLGKDVMRTLMAIARQPFPDLRSASYLVLLKMANQRWGQLKMSTCNDLFDFLLDRRTETDAGGLHMKFKILKEIVDSETGILAFDPILYAAIVEYVKQGPIFSPTVTEVAIEGAE